MTSKSVLPFTIIFLLSSCDTSFGQTDPELSSTLVVLISGLNSDASIEQIARKAVHRQGTSGVYELLCNLDQKGLQTRFFNWNGTPPGHSTDNDPPGAKAIAASVREITAKGAIKHLILVGHSWGGHTMLHVADQLNSAPTLAIELAVAVDASSTGLGGRIERLPTNVRQLINYHSRNSFVWGDWNNEPRVENVDLGDPASGYIGQGKPAYADAFSLSAHNAIEWDERVHRSIMDRIEQMVNGRRLSDSVKSEPGLKSNANATGK